MIRYWHISISPRDVYDPTWEIVVMASTRRELYNVLLNGMSRGGAVTVSAAIRLRLARIVVHMWHRWVVLAEPYDVPRALPWPSDDRAIYVRPATAEEHHHRAVNAGFG